jgi:hypothetical protein
MGGYVPNPVTLTAAKVGGYWLFGAVARRWALHARSPLVFAFLRAGAGLLVGITFLWAMTALKVPGGDLQAYVVFQVFRVVVWATVLRLWFRPRGGLTALALWTVLGTALSIGMDLLFAGLSQLNIPWATWTIC